LYSDRLLAIDASSVGGSISLGGGSGLEYIEVRATSPARVTREGDWRSVRRGRKVVLFASWVWSMERRPKEEVDGEV